MVKGTLVMAMDFPKRKDVKPGVSTRYRDGVWIVFTYGPRHENTFRVTEYDEEGLKWLKAKEVPQGDGPSSSVRADAGESSQATNPT